MRKKLKMISVMLYPYIYLCCLAGYVVLSDKLNGIVNVDTRIIVLMGMTILYNLYAFYVVISTAFKATKGFYSAEELTRTNMMIKLSHIPAYLFHFALGATGLLLSVWGIGFILWAILIDLLTIVLTGIVGTGASICCKRENIFNGKVALLYSVLSFVYCVDVVFAALMVNKSKRPKVS